jgi:hypothetical protein
MSASNASEAAHNHEQAAAFPGLRTPDVCEGTSIPYRQVAGDAISFWRL